MSLIDSSNFLEKILEQANHDKVKPRWKVAENPFTPTEILDKLSTDSRYSVRFKVAKNPNISEKTAINLLYDNDVRVVRTLLQSTKYEKVFKLAFELKDNQLNCIIAKNKYTPCDVLIKLSIRETVDSCAYALAQNKRIPKQALANLSRLNHTGLNYYIFKRKDCPPELKLLSKLSN